MINFFRRIRQSLLTANPPARTSGRAARFSKYGIYAIGEIVLVVIGILIALSINNWNESRKEKEVENRYISSILSDLKDQNASIDINLESEEVNFKAAGQIIRSYQENNALILNKTFYKLASAVTSRKTFVITDPTFTDLVSSGNINILKNAETKKRLINYYQDLERIEKIIQNNNTLLIDQNYISVYNKVGYYFTSLEELSTDKFELNEHMIIPEYENNLEEISKKLFLEDENKLAFMNAIYLRNVVAITNYKFLKDIQSNTQSLIEVIEKLTRD
jgi:hypothetical protein